ncbi:hypothetical protein G6F62_002727 [Rhizopus arrhizus]|nr:hypothetical protein G6F23_000359 [Rhizopus arrhizus]KAG0768422.1 hypothetical protein G6F24_001944 [Rhizopus arrhizus]KAG0788995.1 hypothetical protein G6F22_006845 [Rhizopus arrhizus]KAG0795502.1 hypothetical protein G6F21_002044 [Rhizopus arrhizus]KAG0817396.1 hypothetical protein G6F20_002429 [Rhizopus arrhizus]
MTTQLDHMLYDLEKQVHEFNLNLNEHEPILTDIVQSEKRTERRHPKYENNVSLQQNSDKHDDDVTIGSMLQRSATVGSRRTPNENVGLRHSKSVRGLVRSTSNANMRKKFNDPSIPPVPPLPNEQDLQKVLLETEQQSKTENNRMETSPTLEMNSNTGHVQNIKTLNTRIYIDDANNHRVVQLTNLLTSAMVIQYLKKKGLLDPSNDWTLFEIANSHHVERPLREWELVFDIVSTWEPDGNNALLVKKYSYHYTLTSESIFQKTIQPMYGWLLIEYKKGKWQKRYCFVKDNAIYHAKDKGASSSILCHLASYDVYTLLQPLKMSPTPFVFAIRAQDRASIFEKEGDYIRFMATEDQEEMKQWVLSIRHAKSQIQYQYHPNRVAHPLVSIQNEEKKTQDDSSPTTPLLRRQKSTKVFPTMSRSESSRRLEDKKKPRALTRNPTIKKDEDSPLIDCFDPPKFIKGSLLAQEKEGQQQTNEENNTLIQIDDKVKFAKGSLLAQKEKDVPAKIKRSKSVRELPSAAEHSEGGMSRRHMSLRRKPTVKKLNDDVPLPSNSNTLLQLDDTPESFHSRELHGRHVKPLLNFDERASRR